MSIRKRLGIPAIVIAIICCGWFGYQTVTRLPAGTPQAVELRDATISDQLTTATVLAVGEATHGTAEFREAWQLVAEKVVSHGFTTIALEENTGTVSLADAWVQGGPGTAEEAVKLLGFRLNRTQEMADFLTWARAYNEGKPEQERVRFYGLDMQHPVADRDVAINWLASVDPAAAAQHSQALAEVSDDSAYESAPAQAQLPAAQDLLTTITEAAGSSTSDDALRAVQAARSLVQGLERGIAGYQSYDRDKTLADNLAWLVEQRGNAGSEHTLLLAHNGHVDRAGVAGSPLPGSRLGKLNAERWGEQYRVIGTDSRVTRINDAGKTYQFTVNSPIRGLFTGTDIGYLEIAQASAENREVLDQSMPMASAGSPFEPVQAWVPFMHEVNVVTSQAWDAVIYVADSHPTTPVS